ncbi:hypothetical protein, partial [Vibrio cholerae]
LVHICYFLSLKNAYLQCEKANARLRGWQRITPNSNTTTITTAAQWDWKRHALTVPLEAFVISKIPTLQQLF